MTRTQTAWPTGVIARYLTDAGKALADPTITVDLTEDPEDGSSLGVCRGCETTFEDSRYLSRDLDTGRHWAQEHAETCRALPKPA
ncbi:hypothetical protein ACFWRZ_34310 [Streptomyces rubiginosohelvolus]|uniref:hypothetical protein n=1 Tax=Streptomyces rubiginosohelvolus TaxID=67362 RepID=UPI00365194C0